MLYALATWAIIVDILETFAHFAIATQTAPSGSTGYTIFWFWFGIKWVLFFSTALAWMWAREIPESGPFSPFWAHAFWSLAEIPLGLAAFFIGAGFYVYPSAITLAGVVRLVSWARGENRPRTECKSTIYISAETDDTDCGYGVDGGPPGLYLS
jgi:hypothetical protein